MTRRMYWGVAILILLLGSAAVFKIVNERAEMEAMAKQLREQQLAEYLAKWGEPPSPDGSYQHTFDNHGNVLRHYRGTRIVSHYRFEVGFAPTISELERYKQLIAERKEVIREGDIGEMHRIDDKIQTLVNSAQREVPVPFGYGYYGPQYTEGERTNLRNQALKSFYKRMGVPHLFELHKEDNY